MCVGRDRLAFDAANTKADDVAYYSRSTKNLALARHQKCVPYVPRFVQARLKVSDVSQKKPQTHFCAQLILGAPSHTATHAIKKLSRAFTSPLCRGARPVDRFRCSARGARARRHTSSVNDQRAAPGVSPTSADSQVRAGQRPVDLLLRAISNRWQVHCEIIGNRSIF